MKTSCETKQFDIPREAGINEKKLDHTKSSNVCTKSLHRKPSLGAYDIYLSAMQSENVEEYKISLRMTPQNCDELLGLAEADITKNDTNTRDSISANIKLAGTIRYSQKVIPIYKTNSGSMQPHYHSLFQKSVTPITEI